MKRLVLALLTIAMCISMTGCGGLFAQSGGEGGSGEDGAKTLRVAISKEPKSLLPYESNDTGTSMITGLIYDKLLDFDADMNLIPCLAKEWEQIDDTHYRFTLRDDVDFQNGSHFTAEDVLYTFQQNMASEAAAELLGPVDLDNCVIEDNYTIVMALTEPYPAFLNCCALEISGIVCKEAMESDPEGYASNPIGTGPFMNVVWNTGDSLEFDVNKNYWGGEVAYDKLLLRYIAEATTREIEAESGNVDIAAVTVNDVATVEQAEGIHLDTTEILNTAYISYNCSKEPFNNVKVRQAISCAIDSETIVKTVYKGYTEVAKSVVAPGVSGYYDAGEPYAYDVERAKELMKEAGYEDGFSCTLITNGDQSIAEMVQAYLAEINIDVKLNVTDFSNWLDAVVNGTQDMYLGGWTIPSADGAEGFAPFHSANFGAGGNRSRYSNPEANALVEAGAVETDVTKRNEIYKQLQELLAEECVYKNLNVGVSFWAVSDNIEGFEFIPTQRLKLENITFKS